MAIKTISYYLFATKNDGIYYWRPAKNESLPYHPPPNVHSLPSCEPDDVSTCADTPLGLMKTVIAYWAGDMTHIKSVTGIVLKLAGGTIL